jgi:hypothetical protein
MNSRDFGAYGGLAGIGSGLAGLFGGGGKDPYDAAKGYYDKIPGTISPYFNPYIQAGHGALNQLQGQFGGLINDPSAMYNKVAGGYHQSPGFQWQLGQGMNAAGNAAAAGGLAGSPQHQQQAATMAEGLANQDFQNYMSQALGLYGTGLSGMQGINQMGYNASDQLAGGLANNLQNQGNMAFAGQAARNQSRGSSWGNIFGGLASLVGGLF